MVLYRRTLWILHCVLYPFLQWVMTSYTLGRVCPTPFIVDVGPNLH